MLFRIELNPKFSTFADVKEAFSVEALTKEFYNALFDWYQWAMDSKTGISFPHRPDTPLDDRKQLSEAMIRLITRLMFVWFIKQKGIVPDALFQQDKLTNILRDFEPESMEQDNYYRIILQNLFFATLNCQPDKRKYVKSFHGMSNEQGVKTCYRYKEELCDPDDFLEMMRPVPFLNCALFDCLDKTRDEMHGTPEILPDGFSIKKSRQAHVPNGLFFDEKRGLVKLFHLYEFTVDENNADDSDVALDPELLGKVFENLLGAFNPETQETARKATGSFYTPREIVDYMVEESLRNYLKTKVPNADDARLDDLFDRGKAAEGTQVLFNADETSALLNALYECKILDPACGSGAFPMGVLHCMVRLFGRLDPQNVAQREKLMERYRADSALTEKDLSDDERKERADSLEKQMREGQMFPDYARKLYLIENCIYGVDIQPIATQISKLRFFISLLCDQLRSSYNPADVNYGLLSLPNLEAKFVCANTLLSLPEPDCRGLTLSTGNIMELRQMLQQNRHDIFNARTARTKAKYKERDLEIRDAIRSAVRSELSTPNELVIAAQEKIIADTLKAREAVAEPKIELHEETLGADLFSEGHKEWVETDVNAEPRQVLDRRIAEAKRIIRAEKNKTSQSETSDLDSLATMVAGWDPYDQNACSSFFDPEWMFNVRDGFDIVIGNPPYMQVPKRIFSSEKFPFSEGKDQGKQNLYKVFIEAAYNLSKINSTVCLIVQSSLLGDMSAKHTRELLLTRTTIQKIVEFPKNAPTAQGKVFKAVLQGTCIVIYAKKTPADSHQFAISIGNDKTTMGKLIFENLNQQNVMNFYPEYYEIPLIRSGEASIITKIKKKTIRVKQFLIDEAQGNINTIHLERIRSKTFTGAYIAKGANIHRWLLDSNLFDCVETRETEKLFLQNMDKCLILSQNISGTTDRYRINATPFMSRNIKIVFLDTANILYLRCPGDMKYITAILNSKITDWMFRKTSTNNHLNMYELEAISVPDASAEQQALIVLSVDKILAAKQVDPSSDTTALEAEIDRLVYDLYGLTKEEIALVKASGKSAAEPEETEVETAPKSATPSVRKKKSRRSDDDYLE